VLLLTLELARHLARLERPEKATSAQAAPVRDIEDILALSFERRVQASHPAQPSVGSGRCTHPVWR
jgi:hypothetical protein